MEGSYNQQAREIYERAYRLAQRDYGAKTARGERGLLAALDSIRRSGYRRHDRADGDIEALVFLREDGEWRWQVSRGLHRAAVLAALETDPIPVRVRGLVFRGDAGVWPNVVSGLYTRRGAEKMFDRIFDGAGTPAGSGGGPER